MNLAIEQLHLAIGVAERKLNDAREAQKLNENQAAQHRTQVEHFQKTLVELRAAIAKLHVPEPVVEPEVAAKIADKPVEKSKLSLRPRPDAMKSSDVKSSEAR